MGGLFSTLNTGYSGLKVNQGAIATTSNNIANANNEDYTRQRVEIVSSVAVHTTSGDVGTGAEIKTVVRLKNDYLFNRYTASNRDLSYFNTLEQNVKEIANYFPDVKDVGMNRDIKNYFDAWSTFADNPNDNAVKVDLASKTFTLTNTLKQTRENIDNLNKSVNNQIQIYVDEVNMLVKKIADLNKQITSVEANDVNHANDLRDERDKAEKRLIELTGATVSKEGLISTGVNGISTADYEENYTINLGGYPLVDNGTFNELKIQEDPKSKDGYYSIYFEKQDYKLVDITKDITKGIMGALLDFRGRTYDDSGKTIDGYSSKYIDELDAFSKTLIQTTNSIYAYSAQEEPTGQEVFNPVSLTDAQIHDYPMNSPLVEQSLHNPVREGTLTLSAYDNNGNFVKDIEINIDPNKKLANPDPTTPDPNQYILDDINDQLKNAGVDYKAEIQNGNIVFVKSDTDGDGALNNGALLVKDDGSLLFEAMNDIQYQPLDKSNSQIPLPIKDGKFDLVVYNDDGDEIARRTIVVNSESKDPMYSTMEGILAQINMSNIDDNDDNDNGNDLDDYYVAQFTNGALSLNQKTNDTTYIGFDNDTAGFGGALGMNRFFTGTDSSDIALNEKFQEDPSLLNAYKAPSDGNNDTANDMVQMQYDTLEFTTRSGTTTNTISGYYRYEVSEIANDSERISSKQDTQEALFNSVKQEYLSESGVNLDEEMTQLMKYQNGYQAATKVINTISTMMDALMGLKT